MAKNLRPCNFITKVDGKEKSMSFDQMREYLLANPDVWMPASTRKIGAGKKQASMGRRYHGSPHDFEEFTTEKMGTGEGNQAFGWGLYFTDLESIARGYAKALSTATFDNKKLDDNPLFDRLLTNLDEENSDFYNINTGNITNLKKFKEYIDDWYEHLSEESKKIDENHRSVKRFMQDYEYSEKKIKEVKESLARNRGYNIESATKELIEKGVDEATTKILVAEYDKIRKENIKYLYDAMKYMATRESELKKAINFVKNDFKSDLNYYKFLKNNFDKFKLIRNLYEVTLFEGKKRFELAPIKSNDGKWNVYDYKTWDKIQGMPFDEKQGVLDNLDKAKPEKRFNSKEEALEWIAANNEYTWLEWDRPVSQKAKNIIKNNEDLIRDQINESKYLVGNETKEEKEKILKEVKDELISDLINSSDNKIFYQSLARMLGGQKKASLFLLQNGIDGVKYPAESIARGATSENARGFNYVVFDENAVTVNRKLQFSEGGRGEPAKVSDPIIRGALMEAGKIYRESKNDKRAAISAAVAKLVEAGYDKKEATEIITPMIERITMPTPAGSSTSPAGWIGMEYIPMEVRNKINVGTTTVENMKALGEMAVKNKEVDPERLSEYFANGFARPLTPVEVSAMVYYKAQLHNKINEAYKALEDAKRSGNESQIETEEANVKKLETQLQNYYIASRKSAYEMGLAFRLRQMLLDQDYELTEVGAKYRAKYGPMPAETKATFEELERQRQELLEKEKQLEADREAFEREKTMAGLVQEVEQKKKGVDAGANNDKSFIVRKIFDNISKIPSMFSRKIKGQASAGLRAGEQTDGEYIWEQAVTMAANELQKMDKPDKAAKEAAMKKGLDYVKSTKWYKSFDLDEQKQIDLEYMTFMRANTKDPSVKVTDDEKIVISHKTLRDYTERVLEDNPLDKNDPDRYKKLMELVSKEILKDMVSELPIGTSWQDIRDAITKYGQQTQGSQEELEVEIRNMKQLGLKMAQLEAVLSGNKPLKTGYQRDPQSPEARFLVEQINEGLKKLALSEMESEAFLRTSLDRIKKSLQNQIDSLNQQIKEGKRKSVEKSKVVYDEEATSLKELRDLLQKELDKIDPRDKKVSAENQLNNLINNLERSIKEYERRIKEKDFSAFKQVKAAIENLPRTNEYKALKAQRDAIKKQYEDLKKGPQKSPLDKKLEDLQDEYDSLLDGTYQPKQPPVQYNDPRLKDLRDKISALKLQLGFKKTKEDIKLDKLRKELSDLMAGTTRNRTAPSPDSPQATALKNQIKNLKDQMGITAAAELKRAIKAKEAQLRRVNERIAKLSGTGEDFLKKPKIQNAIIDDLNDQIKLQKEIVQQLLDQHGITVKKLLEAEKKRIRNLIAEKEERIRTKNFGPKVSTARKLTQDEYDQELRDLQVQKQLLYEKYEEEFYKAELDNRPRWQKVLDTALALWDVSKSAVSGIDMSAPLRQGLFLVLSEKPTTTLSAFKFMFEAAFANITDEAAVGRKYEEWLAGVKASPEYQVMKASGLYLAEQTTKGRAAEDAFANNLVYNIPFIEKPIFESIRDITRGAVNITGRDYSLHLYKRSEVAYNAFLNYMRVAAFSDVVESLGNLDQPITFQTHPEEFKSIAEVINISTGRPHLGKMDAAAGYINKIIFSVRLVWSRFLYTFLPLKAPFMPPAARKINMIRYGRAMGSLAAIMKMLYLWLDNDDDEDTYVEIDPRGKFLNVNINENSSLNLTAGMSQWVSFLSKLMTQKYKKTSTGEVRRLGQTMYDPDFLDVIAQFVAGKAAPTPRVLLDYAMAQPNPEEEGELITKFGERYSVLESLGGLAVPLIIGDVGKAVEKNNMLTAMGLGAAAFFGMSVNVKTDKYKLPSEIMKETLDPGGKDYRLETEKVRIAIKEKNAANLKKGIEKQAVPYANYKMIANPDPETAKAMFAESLVKSYKDDALVEKTGLKTDEMRQLFFLIMAGDQLPEIKESNPDKKEKILKLRNELIEKFKSIPEPTRQNILGQYKKQAKEVEDVMSLFNSLGLKYKDLKTNQYKPINWNDFLKGVQWYQEYQYFYKNSAGFRNQVNKK